MPTEEMILLARSRKHFGLCVAGISTETGAWLRPISGEDHGQLYPIHCSCDGVQPGHLDIVRFSHDGPMDDPAQPENVRLLPEPWELVDRIPSDEAYEELKDLLVEGPKLLGNVGSFVPDEIACQGVDASLALIEPEDLRLCLERSSFKAGGSPRAEFTLDGHPYDLPLTEYKFGPALKKEEFGYYTFEDLGFDAPERVFLTVSLGEPWHERRYKLVAAVISVS